MKTPWKIKVTPFLVEYPLIHVVVIIVQDNCTGMDLPKIRITKRMLEKMEISYVFHKSFALFSPKKKNLQVPLLSLLFRLFRKFETRLQNVLFLSSYTSKVKQSGPGPGPEGGGVLEVDIFKGVSNCVYLPYLNNRVFYRVFCILNNWNSCIK